MQRTAKLLLIGTTLVFFSLSLSGCSLGTGKTAALQVTSTPEASIFLDEKHIGKTPFFSDQLRAGEHTLKIAESEAQYSEKINLLPGTLYVLDRKLSTNYFDQEGSSLWLEEGEGVFISSQTDQSTLTIDGRYIGKTPILVKDLSEGDHKAQISKKGYNNYEFSFKSSKKHRLVANITLSLANQNKSELTSKEESRSTLKVQILNTPQGFLRIRKEPSLLSEEIARINSGEEAEFLEDNSDWTKVIYEGKTGWVSKEFIKKL